MAIESFDHVAIPSADPGALIEFYRRLGFTPVGEDAWHAGRAPFVALALGDVKLNVHAPALWQDERFTLLALDAVKGFPDDLYLEIVLWSNRGQRLAGESLYEPPDAG